MKLHLPIEHCTVKLQVGTVISDVTVEYFDKATGLAVIKSHKSDDCLVGYVGYISTQAEKVTVNDDKLEALLSKRTSSRSGKKAS